TQTLENFEDNLSVDFSSHYKNFSLELNLQNKMASRATNYKSNGTDFLDYGTLWNIRFITGQLQYQYNRSDYSFAPRLYYRNSTLVKNTVAVVTDSSQTGYYRPGNLLGIDLLNQYNPSENLDIIGGIVYESENTTGDFSITQSNSPNIKPPEPPKPKMMNNWLISAYLQANYRFLKNFEIVPGLRYDHSSYYGEVFTPRFSFSFRRQNFTSRLLYNEAFRAPRPWDFTFGAGNKGLKPETIQSFEWLNSYRISPVVFVSASLYKNYLENIITTTAYNQSWRLTNSGKIQTNGLELEIRIRKQNLNVWGNYTYNYSVDADDVMIPEISKHTANAGFHYYFKNSVNFGVRANYAGERKNASLSTINDGQKLRFPTIDPLLAINGSAGFTLLKNIDCMLYVNNLLNTKNYHSSNRPPDRYRQAQRYFALQLFYKIQ
ncbi:MAG: TonB-dependent receptor, partial [Sphingobacteriia bacterium]|nr:TonB-dependent receptor [Sphingobacteriia bacterium]